PRRYVADLLRAEGPDRRRREKDRRAREESGEVRTEPQLIHGSVPGRDRVSVDQGAIRGSRRSNLATYTGLFDPILETRSPAPSYQGAGGRRSREVRQ